MLSEEFHSGIWIKNNEWFLDLCKMTSLKVIEGGISRGLWRAKSGIRRWRGHPPLLMSVHRSGVPVWALPPYSWTQLLQKRSPEAFHQARHLRAYLLSSLPHHMYHRSPSSLDQKVPAVCAKLTYIESNLELTFQLTTFQEICQEETWFRKDLNQCALSCIRHGCPDAWSWLSCACWTRKNQSC